MGDAPNAYPLPEHPELRDIAVALDAGGAVFELMDDRFRLVYQSQEFVESIELTPEEAIRQLGQSHIRRALTEESDILRVNRESGTAWFEHNAPIMRRYVDPADADFDAIFGPTAPFAAEVTPAESAPRAWHDLNELSDSLRFRRTMLGAQHQMQIRINDDAGQFIGLLNLYRPMLGEGLLLRLGRGDPQLFNRMDRVREPARRAAAILFADLEASGPLSRRLSSQTYFELIRDLTDLIDTSVLAQTGIVGKHAGDGGSALFLSADFDASESGTARAAVASARAIRKGSARLGPENFQVKVNVGLHWGSTLMVGQIATTGRLEVTALGDQMNECARIEAAATSGAILASKELLERLNQADAEAVAIDLNTISYSTISELADGNDAKVVRDAGSIAVASI
jgi:class 3 adenylate cyclase